MDCPSSIKKKNNYFAYKSFSPTEVHSEIQPSLADSTAQHNNSWHEMNPKIMADKKGTLGKKNAIIPMGVAPGHLC